MIIRTFLRHILLLMITLCIAGSLQGEDSTQIKNNKNQNSTRTKRGKTTPKPGFFKTLWSVTWEQIAETKDTYHKVNDMINNNFLPDNPPLTVSTTPNSDPNISTTTEPYRISRKEFNRIIQRNLRGLNKLFNIELKQALGQSDKNYADFKKNASKEISKFL